MEVELFSNHDRLSPKTVELLVGRTVVDESVELVEVFLLGIVVDWNASAALGAPGSFKPAW